MRIPSTIIVSALAVVWLMPLPSYAQGTAFTYQGRLTDNGAPANGTYDLQFAVYDALTNGNQVAGPFTNPTTEVSNGIFTVALDFGTNVFPGSARWLEIRVRPGESALAYTVLTPRQSITATPYAITSGVVTGPINGSQITPGSVTGAQLASGAALSNLNASGQTGVPHG